MFALTVGLVLVPDACFAAGLAHPVYRVREASARLLAAGDPVTRLPTLRTLADCGRP